VRHGGGPFLAHGEEFLHFEDLGPLQVADLGGELVEEDATMESVANTSACRSAGSPGWRRGRARAGAYGRRALPRRDRCSRRFPPPRRSSRPRSRPAPDKTGDVAAHLVGPKRHLPPNVTGSAWMPCVRPIITVPDARGRGPSGHRRPLPPRGSGGRGPAHLGRRRGVQNVGARHPHVEEAGVVADVLGHGGQERR